MTQNITLPPMQDAVLDEETLQQLFVDLSEVADTLEVRMKFANERPASEGSSSLAAAIAALSSRSVAGVQVHYRHDGVEWTDTLMPGPEGIRLVRIQHRLPGDAM